MAGSAASGGPVRVVVVGHVDHGKSTLIGRLLYDTGTLAEGRCEQLKAAASKRGRAFEWASLMDALQAERDQNVTIDVAHIWFQVGGRPYQIIDAPGHREFLRNMVTGASQADAALVVIDAEEGVGEQTRRHSALLRLLDLRQIVVLVNKMDLVGFSEDRFRAIVAEYAAFLKASGLSAIVMVPIAARDGDNLAARGDRLDWFDGPTVVEALARLSPRPGASDQPFRMPVQDVYRFDRRRVAVGRVEAGRVRVGDALVFQPKGQRSRVQSIERWNAPDRAGADAGESIGLMMADELFLERGTIASLEEHAPGVTSTLQARVFWLGRKPLAPGRAYRLRLSTQDVECEVGRIVSVIDAGSLEQSREPEPVVETNRIAEVVIRTASPLVADRFDDVPALGRFVIVEDFDIVGGGIVTGIGEPSAATARAISRSSSLVTATDRASRFGHRGAVVWFTGLSGSGKSTLSYGLERTLFDKGMQAFVLDGDNLRFGLNADLGFSASDRAENIRRVAEVAKLFAESGLIAITAFISPYRSDRRRARQIMKEGGVDIPFIEVHLDVPVEVCETRDPKGLYKKARAGRIAEFTGVSAPYEAPEHAELNLRTGESTIDACLDQLLVTLLSRVARPGTA